MGNFFSYIFGRKTTTTERPDNRPTTGSHGNVHIINTSQEWEAKISEANTTGKIVVVDFSATWCGPCNMIAPFYTELSQKHPQLVFLKVDVDKLRELSETWNVQAMPTFVFIKNGKQIDTLVGADKSELEKKVKSYATAARGRTAS